MNDLHHGQFRSFYLKSFHGKNIKDTQIFLMYIYLFYFFLENIGTYIDHMATISTTFVEKPQDDAKHQI